MESGRLGWQVTSLAVLVGERGALVERVVLAVDHRDGVAAAIEHEDAPAVGTGNAIDGTLAEGNARGDSEAGDFKRVGLADLRDRGGRVVADHVEGNVLADGVDVLPEQNRVQRQ